jgi:hypothetical protein
MESRSTDALSFVLERFAWGAPDRLELVGTFAGLDGTPADLPVLILSGGERTHRLPAADVSGAPKNGRPWRATFVWQEAPAAFESAVLQLGGGLAVDLPEPGEDGAAPDNVELPVWVPSRDDAVVGAGGELLRLEAELLAAREELLESQSNLRRAEGELRRAHEDLDTERAERAADAVRFRDGIATVQDSAEQALGQMRAALAAAHETLEARDAELAEARGELDVAGTFRAEAEAATQAELAALQERLDEARRRIETARSALQD